MVGFGNGSNIDRRYSRRNASPFDKAFPFIGFVPASLVRPPAIFEVLAEAYENEIIQHCPVTIDCQDAAGNKLTCAAKTRYKWRGGVPGTTRVELVLRGDAEDDA